jgi:hypothetical protein
MASGCAVGERPSAAGAFVLIPETVPIPAGSAHASLQNGRWVGAAGRLDPYCELEIRTVSDRPQQALPGRYGILGERFTLLRDPTTRLPALITGFSCSDPLFQESFWRLSNDSGGNLHSLRCIRPIFHCALAPPLMLDEVGAVTGPAVQVRRPGG